MINHEKLRYRSPFTDKVKASMILQYSEAGMILDVPDDAERGRLISAILRSELYEDEPTDLQPKTLGVYYAVTAALDVRGGEWLHSCKRNRENSPKGNRDGQST